MDDDGVGAFFAGIIVVFVAIFILLAVFNGLWVGEDKAVHALETQGFSDVEIKDRQWFFVGLRGCSDSDSVKFVAEATNPVGQRVEIFVCSAWLFKGATIRT